MVKREKQRYLGFTIFGPKKMTKREVNNEFWKEYTSLFGTIGAANSGMYLIEYDEEEKRGIIRIRHDMINNLTICCALIRGISDHKCIVHRIGVSGTIKGLKKKMGEKIVSEEIKDLFK
ncbi:MAG: Rpp14/Pop5 family protein [Candidatus Kariarchaeaceae archaeon]